MNEKSAAAIDKYLATDVSPVKLPYRGDLPGRLTPLIINRVFETRLFKAEDGE